jgi:ribosomal protein S8
LMLINTLYRVGCVQRFLLSTEHRNGRRIRFAYISTPFFKQVPYFKSVRLVSTPSKRHTISLKSLRIITMSIRSSLIILSTPYGIVNHNEALRLRTGGLILCFIN